MATTCKARVPMAEQIRPINECCQSGMTNEQLSELAPWSENSNLSKIACEL